MSSLTTEIFRALQTLKSASTVTQAARHLEALMLALDGGDITDTE